MNRTWNGSCKSRRTWEGIAQDFSNCTFNPGEKAGPYDEERAVFLEVAQDLDGFKEYQAHKDGWEV